MSRERPLLEILNRKTNNSDIPKTFKDTNAYENYDGETDDNEDGSRSRQPTITHMSSLGGAAEVDRVRTEEVETTSKEKCLLGSSV